VTSYQFDITRFCTAFTTVLFTQHPNDVQHQIITLCYLHPTSIELRLQTISKSWLGFVVVDSVGPFKYSMGPLKYSTILPIPKSGFADDACPETVDFDLGKPGSRLISPICHIILRFTSLVGQVGKVGADMCVGSRIGF